MRFTLRQRRGHHIVGNDATKVRTWGPSKIIKYLIKYPNFSSQSKEKLKGDLMPYKKYRMSHN